jgi:hypothetical protein
MEFYKFSKDTGKRISKFNSNFIMSRVIQTDKASNIGCMHLEENGIVGYQNSSSSTFVSNKWRRICSQ